MNATTRPIPPQPAPAPSATTPGPWCAKHDHPTIPAIAHVYPVTPDGYYVQEICTLYGRGDDNRRESSEADARLIAASPDLLARLAESTYMLRELLVHITTPVLREQIVQQIADNDAVIGRVEGQS